MELVLSPVYHAWNKKRLKDFYLNEVVNMDVSTVYVGEVICQKRDILNEDDFKEIIAALKSAGKTVYHSTLALITSQDELDESKRFLHLFDGVEVNSFGVLNLLIKDKSLKDKKIIIGPFMNIYNSVAADFLLKFNPERFVTPYEVPFDTIKDVAANIKTPLEVYAWGQLSTALSWRCYTARTFNLERNTCALKCFDYPDGILLKTVKDEPLYVENGIQVLSSKMHCIIEQIDMLKDINMPYLRITPSHEHTSEVVKIFSDVVNGRLDSKEAVTTLSDFAEHGLSNGWFLGKPGWEYTAA
jgi:collagenase-like PrtC family protease